MNNLKPDQDVLKRMSVLYVEDEEDVRDQFTEFLSRIVGTLLIAADGVEGLELFAKNRPHIVITDIQMPGMDGLTMAEKIHEMDSSVPIIVMTAFEPMDYLVRAALIGIEKYVTKPIESDHLLKCLNECAQTITCVDFGSMAA